MRTSQRFVLFVLFLLMILCPSLFAAQKGEGEVARLLKTIQAAKPDESRAVQVRDTQIDMGPGILVIDEGILLPAAAVNGRTLEVAFVGEASFRFSTADPAEYHQLELFTGERALNTAVTHAILVTGQDEVFAKLLDVIPLPD